MIDSCFPAPSSPAVSKPGCNAVPAQFVLGSGQAQVSNQVQTPNITANLTGVMVKSLGFQDSNQLTQSWGINPVTDYADLKRLRALYKFAVTREEPAQSYGVDDFTVDYASAPVNGGKQNSASPNPWEAANLTTNPLDYDLPLPPLPGQSAQWAYKMPSTKWVYWDSQPRPPEAVPVGSYSNHTIYVRASDLEDFLIWVLGATANTNGGGGGGKGGKNGIPSGVSPLLNPQ